MLLRPARSAVPPSCAVQTLQTDGLLRIAHPLGMRVDCLEGSLWITQDGDLRDVVLQAGQSFCPQSAQPVLISALAGACASVRLSDAA